MIVVTCVFCTYPTSEILVSFSFARCVPRQIHFISKMPLEQFDGLELPATADFHVHLRDGEMMKLVTPTIRQGGVNTVFVMVRNINEIDVQLLM